MAFWTDWKETVGNELEGLILPSCHFERRSPAMGFRPAFQNCAVGRADYQITHADSVEW